MHNASRGIFSLGCVSGKAMAAAFKARLLVAILVVGACRWKQGPLTVVALQGQHASGEKVASHATSRKLEQYYGTMYGYDDPEGEANSSEVAPAPQVGSAPAEAPEADRDDLEKYFDYDLPPPPEEPPCPMLPGICNVNGINTCKEGTGCTDQDNTEAAGSGKKCVKKGVCGPFQFGAVQLQSFDSSTKTNASSFAMGVCAPEPAGGFIFPLKKTTIPTPLAYFPLTSGQVETWPSPIYKGFLQNVEVVDDDLFGSALHCSQDQLSAVFLDNIPYGRTGRFAVGLWFRGDNSTGDLFQYILGHGNVPSSLVANVTNFPREETVTIYLPEFDHPGAGLVRVIVIDSTDLSGLVFVDSDGQISNNSARRPSLVDVTDGRWHFVVVSTQQVGKGYKVFLDGKLVASINDTSFLLGSPTTLVPPYGGDAINPKGQIHLCSRSDRDIQRHFSGRVAHLMFFDTSLKNVQVKEIFEEMLKAAPGEQPPAVPPPVRIPTTTLPPTVISGPIAEQKDLSTDVEARTG